MAKESHGYGASPGMKPSNGGPIRCALRSRSPCVARPTPPVAGRVCDRSPMRLQRCSRHDRRWSRDPGARVPSRAVHRSSCPGCERRPVRPGRRALPGVGTTKMVQHSGASADDSARRHCNQGATVCGAAGWAGARETGQAVLAGLTGWFGRSRFFLPSVKGHKLVTRTRCR